MLCCLARPFGRTSAPKGRETGWRACSGNHTTQPLLIESPATCGVLFFFARCIPCDSAQRTLRRYGRRPPGSLCLPSGRPGRSPLNSRRPARMPPGPLASAVARPARSSSGGERYSSLTTGRKDSRSRGDNGTDGRPRGPAAQASGANNLSASPSGEPSANFSSGSYLMSP